MNNIDRCVDEINQYFIDRGFKYLVIMNDIELTFANKGDDGFIWLDLEIFIGNKMTHEFISKNIDKIMKCWIFEHINNILLRHKFSKSNIVFNCSKIENPPAFFCRIINNKLYYDDPSGKWKLINI